MFRYNEQLSTEYRPKKIFEAYSLCDLNAIGAFG